MLMHITKRALHKVVIRNVCEVRLNSLKKVEDTGNFLGTHETIA